FYVQTFGAERSSEPVTLPDGRVHHAELRVGSAEFVVADEFPELGLLGPRSGGGASGALILHVVDADLTWRRAIAAGAERLRPVTDRFGLRAGWLVDPFGHRWEIATQT
ncbi:MAG: VOC family protein, partial [Candidatus Dormibacteraceae bacterium]